MRRFPSLILWLLLAPATGLSQSPEPEILAVVRSLFDAMRTADSAAARVLFHPEARLVSVDAGSPEATIRILSIDPFIAAIGSEHELWDERIRDPEVRQDGPLATVWTRYLFYRGPNLSHCGVDAFHLIRTAEGWKIIEIADTRRTQGCGSPGG